MKRKVVFLGLLLGLPMLIIPVIRAEVPAPALDKNTVILSAHPHFGGYYKYGEWLPLRVAVTNNGADLHAELHAVIQSGSIHTIYAVPISLPTGTHKEITLYVLPPSFARRIAVNLTTAHQIIASAQVNVYAIRNITYVVGVIAPNPDPYQLIAGMDLDEGHRRIEVVPFPLADLPERAEALRTFDALIIADSDTLPLSPAQVEALRMWVGHGGHLIVAGGPSAERTLAGLPVDLKPITLRRVTLSEFDALAEFAQVEPLSQGGKFVAVLPDPSFGRGLVTQDDQTLISEKRPGKGWVHYLAFDPALSPFVTWAGMRTVWKKLLTLSSAYPLNLPPDASEGQMMAQSLAYTVTNLPSLDLPSISWLVALLGFYIALVGPINYFVLRRWRRLDWGWLSIPTLTLAFAGISFGIGYSLRGSEVILNQISLVQKMSPPSPAQIRSYVGIFSPSRRTYTVKVSDHALVSPLNSEPERFGGPFEPTNMMIVEGKPTVVRNLAINQWSMQGFQVEHTVPAEEWKITADLQYDGTLVKGTMHNGSSYRLTDLIAVVGSRYARLGDLPPGGRLDVVAELKGNDFAKPPFPYALFEELWQPGNTPPPREVVLKQSLLNGVFEGPFGPRLPAGLTVIAWLDRSPVTVTLVEDEAYCPAPCLWKALSKPRAVGHHQTTLFVLTVPLDLSGQEVTIPSGVIVPRLLESQNEANSCGPDGRVYLGPTGKATLEYLLPLELLDMTITEMTLSIALTVDPSAGLPATALYDWETGTWTEQKDLHRGDNAIQQPARFVNPSNGALRLQLSGEGFRGSDCVRYDIGVKATRGKGA
jgi:hypothetical protein